MSENLEVEGTLSDFEKGKSGKKQDGTPFTRYVYEITKPDGNKFKCSGFIPPGEFVEEYVIVTYVTKEDGEKTYNNVKNIVEGVPKDNAVPAPQAPQKSSKPEQSESEPDWDKINGVKDEKILFARCSNQAHMSLLGLAIKRASSILDFEGIYKEGFSRVFDVIYEENIKKRKEKGG